MEGSLIEVSGYDGNGYKPLVSFETWRVAVLRYSTELEPANIKSMERHTCTDEVFVLISGKAMLIVGGNGSAIRDISTQTMRIGEITNVKRNTWHTILVSRDAHIIIVENDDTGKENSEYLLISSSQQAVIQKMAKETITI